MVKRLLVSMVIAFVLLTITAPSVVGEVHEVIRSDRGPRSDAVSWELIPSDYRMWRGTVFNDGLRSLIVDVYDNSTGVPVEIMHQKIRFASYDAYPTGIVVTDSVMMAPTHKYLITVIPNGPKGSSCEFDDGFHFTPPVALFSCSVSYLTVYVDGSLSYDPDGVIVAYVWDFGDGATASGVTSQHTYAEVGIYTLALTVTDNDGLTGTATWYAPWPPPPPIVADFSYVVSGMTVTVDGSLSYDPDGILVSYEWDFGDGSSATGITASHTYVMIGTYTITLKVTDNNGYTAYVSRVVPVIPPPPVVLSFTCYVTDLTVVVDASASITYEYAGIDWDWGDGTTGTGVISTHTYATYGDKTITLTVTDMLGLTTSTSKTVTLAP